ncbi:AAC(3) family N-acetyltransferase [Streptomyces sp. S.PB5]|uniref:AAC(3) family N-acetyltransferase n=1 Tax=Streptomyces sp. S.PB5 TaxID=3020844 RepID=UPI00339D446E
MGGGTPVDAAVRSARAPARSTGWPAERVRVQPGALRGAHPQTSFAAAGPLAEYRVSVPAGRVGGVTARLFCLRAAVAPASRGGGRTAVRRIARLSLRGCRTAGKSGRGGVGGGGYSHFSQNSHTNHSNGWGTCSTSTPLPGWGSRRRR